MADMVAWSEIRHGEAGEDDKPGDTKVIKPGESVSQGDLGLDDDQWAQLVESGAVRTMAYPEMPETFQGSPVDYLREQAKMAAEGALMEAETSEENMAAIAAANAASTGSTLAQTFDPEVQAEMDKQMGTEGSSPAPTKASSSSSSGEGK